MIGLYQRAMAKRPFATPVIASAVLFGVGDIMCQQGVEQKGLNKHDWMRTGRLVGYGGIVFGPAATQWYKILTKINLQSKTATTVARVLADQTVFASLNLGLFLSSMAYLEGADPAKRLRDTYFSTLKANWMVWPPVQAVNFTLVPLEMRVLVVNFVSLFWNCYLSWINAGGGKASIAQEAEDKAKQAKEKVQEKL